MTKDEIIKLAREAGIDVSLYDMGAASCVFSEGCHGVARDEFQRFARACYEAGRTVEREECAKVAEDLFASTGRTFDHRAIAAAIRARGKP
jgi:RNA-splicing ligase RtcB